uniref:Uncharacterized protein n=1 Tax=Oryza sativa subsp. japonica TaxID=39947 RepID=Q5Z6L3_ORYSJ|nr:hypothetical protein [Oryza sativa Japonica Group]
MTVNNGKRRVRFEHLGDLARHYVDHVGVIGGDGACVTNLQQQVSRVRPSGEVMHQHEVMRLPGGGHPDGAGVESESVSELERGGAEDGMRVGRGAVDLARELPHNAGGGLLVVADEAKAEIAVVEPAGLVTEQRLPDLVKHLGPRC